MRRTLLTGACTLALVACGGNDDAPEAAPATETAATATDGAAAQPAGSAFLEENAARDGVTVTESGLQIETLEEGDGPSPTEEDVLRIEFEVRRPGGEVLGSSAENGAPVAIPSYRVLQLPGLLEGMPTMKEGGKTRFVLPADLAYGAEGGPGLSPGEPVIFDISLVEVIDPEDEARLTEVQEEEMARMEERRAAAMAEFEAMGAENAAASEAFLAEMGARDGVETTDSGLLYEVVEAGGEGESPAATDVVEVNYRGTLPDGTEFDSSYSRGQSATFPLNQVIPGWTEGVQLMNVGDTYRFYVPSDLAYGETGTPGGPIGPNQALVFDVELLGIEPAPAEGAEAEPQD
ncbi:FKBP-type peptidyl-prolyl cis-trans isomerase [Parvularcula dongshanensis]|uniref:peptidylprolyl isomerase n=1 Tax=Parvularcula dongshanensis TaxID=1173995 RepID=A0A840I1S7_9PROT|nr:FKBP-type peptidyl-prolyl cis-trans isomerase [Parvularcula dongshanensis]MBB4658202.1 FKBP-type peptidyl-prolyl cis-trans isomerase [Parvularcula dongshanensis]